MKTTLHFEPTYNEAPTLHNYRMEEDEDQTCEDFPYEMPCDSRLRCSLGEREIARLQMLEARIAAIEAG
jgi:hypothetical protein